MSLGFVVCHLQMLATLGTTCRYIDDTSTHCCAIVTQCRETLPTEDLFSARAAFQETYDLFISKSGRNTAMTCPRDRRIRQKPKKKLLKAASQVHCDGHVRVMRAKDDMASVLRSYCSEIGRIEWPGNDGLTLWCTHEVARRDVEDGDCCGICLADVPDEPEAWDEIREADVQHQSDGDGEESDEVRDQPGHSRAPGSSSNITRGALLTGGEASGEGQVMLDLENQAETRAAWSTMEQMKSKAAKKRRRTTLKQPG